MLKENINIDWSYTDRVVRQLVDETEIDFKNSRVRLEAAEYSFPFYSFGARRAYPENLISEPNSNFGKYVISNYGVDETEYKEIYAMYMGIIASRLQDHDENVNHLNLHESNYTPKYYAPKWGVRRENDMLDRIVDGLVEESRIEYVEEIVHLADFSFQLFKGPFASLYSIPETSPFYQHCMDVYGLTPEEITYVWKEYRNIIRKEMQSNPLSNLHSPFNESINESTENNFLDKIVEQLVDETQVFNHRGQLRAIPPFFESDYEDVELEGRATGVVGGIPLAELIDSVESRALDYSLTFMDFKYYCKQMYGLTWEESHEVWDKYREALYNTDFSHLYTPNINLDESSLNPSYRESEAVPKPLDRIVYQLVNETIIEEDQYGMAVAYPSWITDHEEIAEKLGIEKYAGVALDILVDSDKNSTNFTEFSYYVEEMYGLDEEEIAHVWSRYKGWLREKDQKRVDDFYKSLDESVEDNDNDLPSDKFLDRIVIQLVDETVINDDANGVPVAYPSWVVEMEYAGIYLDNLIGSNKDSGHFFDFQYHTHNMYGLNEDENEYVWHQYRSGLWEKDQKTVDDYQKSLKDEDLNESLSSRVKKEVDDLFDKDKKLKGEDNIKKYFEDKGLNKQDADEAMVQYLSKQQSLNESPDDLNSYIQKGVDKMVGNTPYIHKVVDKMVDNTHLIYEKPTNTIMAKLPFYIIDMGFKEGHIDTVGQSYLVHPTARIVAEIRKHLILIYGMDKWEADAAALMYLSKMTEKINDYKREGLTESENKKEKHLDRVLDHLVSGTTIKKEIDRDVIIKVPYLPGNYRDEKESGYYLSSHIFHSASSHYSFIDYGKEVYGLTEDEINYIAKKYIEILRYKIKHQPYKLDESKDNINTFTDDKDFPFLNKLANHAMRETEISRNAVRFPFIDGYISNNNFHRYFDGTSYDQLPFEASIEADQYLKDFGLTENEKEIWWDIYIVKVIDAVNERDLKIIDNYGELNESKQIDYLDKVVEYLVYESKDDKLPFDNSYISFNVYIKNIYGITDEEVDYVYFKYRYLVGWDEVRRYNEYLPESLNESTGDNVLDKIAHSMYKESISTPDSFPFDSTSMSFDDYVKNMYGISDEEADYVYREFRYLKGWSELDPYLPDRLNEHDEPEDTIYHKIANSIANESEIVVSPAPYNKMFLKGPAWEQAQHIENVIDQLRGMERNSLPDRFVKHLKEIFNIEKKGYNTVVQTIWRLYRNKMIKKIEDAKERLNVPNKQQKFFDHIVKTLVGETKVEISREVDEDEITHGLDVIWVTPPFITHGIDVPRYQQGSLGSVEWSDFSYFGYGYPRYMKEIYGLTDKEALKLWAVYYKALEKKVDEVIERDRIIYGDDR